MLEDLLEKVASGLSRVATKPNIYNYVPNPGGQTAFHKSQAKGRLLAGSNRSGKTVAGIVEDCWWLLQRHPYIKTPDPPVFGRVITVDFDYGADQIIVPQLSQWLPPSALINGSWEDSYNKKKHLLTLANGSKLEIKAHGQALESFAGTPRHFLHVDEECPENIFIESKLRLVDFNGSYWMTLTPVEGITWVYDSLVDGATKHAEVFEIDIRDNPHLSKEAIDTIAEDLAEEERAIRIAGKFVPRGGRVYDAFDEKRHVIPPGIPPKNYPWYVSMDSGYNNPTAVYWHAIYPEGMVVTFAEHYKSKWTARQHAEKIKELNKKFGKEPEVYVGDPSMDQTTPHTGTSLLVEYRNLGIPIVTRRVRVNVGVDKINDYLKRDMWFITEDCPNLIREIRKLPWKRYSSNKIASRSNKREEPLKKDDHGPDSCRYLFTFVPDISQLGRIPEDPRSKVKLSKTITQPERYPWHIDEQLYSMDPQYELGWGEIL